MIINFTETKWNRCCYYLLNMIIIYTIWPFQQICKNISLYFTQYKNIYIWLILLKCNLEEIHSVSFFVRGCCDRMRFEKLKEHSRFRVVYKKSAFRSSQTVAALSRNESRILLIGFTLSWQLLFLLILV